MQKLRRAGCPGSLYHSDTYRSVCPFGSSRHLVVGADSATAAILATALVTMAVPDSPQYIALAGMVALLAAGLLILSRILKLGFIADFLSRAVLIGFLTGVGIQVALGQVPAMFGVPKEGNGPILQAVHVFTQEIPLMNSITVVAFGPGPDHHLCRRSFPQEDPLGTPRSYRDHHCVLGIEPCRPLE